MNHQYGEETINITKNGKPVLEGYKEPTRGL